MTARYIQVLDLNKWDHQVLRHPYMSLTSYGQYLMAMSGTAAEDEADRYGARFLRAHGYELRPVLGFLFLIPDGPQGDFHSKGPTRAKNIVRAY
jgi:hypothetical protein